MVFAAPAGVSWTLPLYELALLSATELEQRDVAAEIVMLTPEVAPLSVFGPEVGAHVGVAAGGAGDPAVARRGPGGRAGRVFLGSGEAIAADGVVAVPRLVGRRISGVPADWNGFVHTDRLGRVRRAHGRVRRR